MSVHSIPTSPYPPSRLAVDSLFYSYTAKITSDLLLPLILFFRLLHSPIDRLSILCVLFPAPEVQPFKFEGGMKKTSRWGRAGKGAWIHRPSCDEWAENKREYIRLYVLDPTINRGKDTVVFFLADHEIGWANPSLRARWLSCGNSTEKKNRTRFLLSSFKKMDLTVSEVLL